MRFRAMGVRGGRMLLGFIVLAYAMMMSGLKAVMLGSCMMSGGLLMML